VLLKVPEAATVVTRGVVGRMGSNAAFVWITVAALALGACAPFQRGMPKSTPAPAPAPTKPGGGPEVPTPPAPAPTGQPPVEAPVPAPPPRERPRTPPATLGAASKALVGQAQTQRQKGDFPGATVSLERALRIEPNNPLLWIEMGRLRMDQSNFAQAETMGRKALSMSVGDDRTQSLAWALISDSLRARGKNPQAQEALERSKELAQR
jgi:tetratricopeptide repeat protein